jgi:peptidoglycan/xylan/chitin deacetylase (PgdA/CDA1 family)
VGGRGRGRRRHDEQGHLLRPREAEDDRAGGPAQVGAEGRAARHDDARRRRSGEDALSARLATIAAALAVAVAGCSKPAPDARADAGANDAGAPAQRPPASPTASAAPKPPRPQLDGSGFPEGVLALTWDDGPDTHTLELAKYLRSQGVRATFFVVRSWVPGVSADPGEGDRVFATGFSAYPILGDLVKLGHRLGNHTAEHVILTDVPPADAVRQLAQNQASLAHWVGWGPRMFRAPGGAWNDAVARAVDASPDLAGAWGPFRWDVDGKDWEGSRWCRSDDPQKECEPGAPGGGPRVRPAVIAARYLAQIEAKKLGIVLLHDRVGHVGSRYALDVARALVPALVRRGYVFASPRLAFQPPQEAPLPAAHGAADAGDALRGDLNGDGRADRCERTPRGIACALATASGFTTTTPWLDRADAATAALVDAPSLALADADGDGRADLCADLPQGRRCALAP